jgi:hypothetical protein
VFKDGVESDRARNNNINKINNEMYTDNELGPPICLRTNEEVNGCYLNVDMPSEQDIICLSYINENNVETCPQIPMVIGNQHHRALIDTGCQCSIIAEELYNDHKAKADPTVETIVNITIYIYDIDLNKKEPLSCFKV